MIDRTPRVFISYSWTSTKFQQQVKELAERLVRHMGFEGWTRQISFYGTMCHRSTN